MAYAEFIAASAIVPAPGYANPAQTVQWPAGIQDGDFVLLVGVIESGNYTPTVTGGFEVLQRNGGSQFRNEIYTARKIYRSGDTAPTVHPGQSYNSRWRSVAFRASDQTTPIEAARQSAVSEADSTINIAANTSTIGEVLQVVVAAQLESQATTLTPNSPLNQVVASDGGIFGFVVATAAGPVSAGAVSAKTITTSRTNIHGHIDFLLRPANPSPVTSVPVTFSGNVPGQSGTVGTAFQLQLAPYFAGSQTPFSYSLAAGSLSGTGLSLVASTGAITGTPTSAGTIAGLQVQVTDADGNTALTNTFAITVSAAAQVPQGTFSVGSITVGQNTASVPYAYSAGDATSIQYQINSTGTIFTATGSPVSLSGLTAGTAYTIRFRAVNAVGPQSTWSAAVNFTTSPAGAAASFTTGVLTDLNGIVQANKALVYLAAYNKTTGQLVVRKTAGLTTDANGRCTISDSALTTGQEYRWDWETVDGHRCMPLGTAQ